MAGKNICPQCGKTIERHSWQLKDGTWVTDESVIAEVQNPYWSGRTLESHRCKAQGGKTNGI